MDKLDVAIYRFLREFDPGGCEWFCTGYIIETLSGDIKKNRNASIVISNSLRRLHRTGWLHCKTYSNEQGSDWEKDHSWKAVTPDNCTEEWDTLEEEEEEVLEEDKEYFDDEKEEEVIDEPVEDEKEEEQILDTRNEVGLPESLLLAVRGVPSTYIVGLKTGERIVFRYADRVQRVPGWIRLYVPQPSLCALSNLQITGSGKPISIDVNLREIVWCINELELKEEKLCQENQNLTGMDLVPLLKNLKQSRQSKRNSQPEKASQ